MSLHGPLISSSTLLADAGNPNMEMALCTGLTARFGDLSRAFSAASFLQLACLNPTRAIHTAQEDDEALVPGGYGVG